MYSVGEEFERLVEDDMEYLTCIANITIGDREYLVCENENGIKRVFHYDSMEEELELLEDDESDEVLEVWEEEYYGTDKEYMFWNEEFGEYDEVKKDEEELNDIENIDGTSLDYDELDTEDLELQEFEEEEDLDEFLEDLLDDEDEEF